MPGIFGSVTATQLSNKINPALANEFHFKTEQIESDNYSISLVGFDFQKEYQHIFELENLTIAIYGDPLLNGLTGNSARLEVVKILQEFPASISSLHLIDGLFSAIVIDHLKHDIYLIGDRNGLSHIYYSYKNNELHFSSDLRSFVSSALNLTLREEAIDEFMELGYHIGDNTYFEEVKLLSPASLLKFNLDDGSVEKKEYWNFKEIKKITPSYKEAKKQIAQLLKNSINKRVGENERVGVTLSGGLDSRLLFAGMPKRNQKFTAITRGREGCGDIKVAKEVAKLRSDSQHIIYDMNVDNWLKNRQGGG